MPIKLTTCSNRTITLANPAGNCTIANRRQICHSHLIGNTAYYSCPFNGFCGICRIKHNIAIRRIRQLIIFLVVFNHIFRGQVDEYITSTFCIINFTCRQRTGIIFPRSLSSFNGVHGIIAVYLQVQIDHIVLLPDKIEIRIIDTVALIPFLSGNIVIIRGNVNTSLTESLTLITTGFTNCQFSISNLLCFLQDSIEIKCNYIIFNVTLIINEFICSILFRSYMQITYSYLFLSGLSKLINFCLGDRSRLAGILRFQILACIRIVRRFQNIIRLVSLGYIFDSICNIFFLIVAIESYIFAVNLLACRINCLASAILTRIPAFENVLLATNFLFIRNILACGHLRNNAIIIYRIIIVLQKSKLAFSRLTNVERHRVHVRGLQNGMSVNVPPTCSRIISLVADIISIRINQIIPNNRIGIIPTIFGIGILFPINCKGGIVIRRRDACQIIAVGCNLFTACSSKYSINFTFSNVQPLFLISILTRQAFLTGNHEIIMGISGFLPIIVKCKQTRCISNRIHRIRRRGNFRLRILVSHDHKGAEGAHGKGSRLGSLIVGAFLHITVRGNMGNINLLTLVDGQVIQGKGDIGTAFHGHCIAVGIHKGNVIHIGRHNFLVGHSLVNNGLLLGSQFGGAHLDLCAFRHGGSHRGAGPVRFTRQSLLHRGSRLSGGTIICLRRIRRSRITRRFLIGGCLRRGRRFLVGFGRGNSFAGSSACRLVLAGGRLLLFSRSLGRGRLFLFSRSLDRGSIHLRSLNSFGGIFLKYDIFVLSALLRLLIIGSRAGRGSLLIVRRFRGFFRHRIRHGRSIRGIVFNCERLDRCEGSQHRKNQQYADYSTCLEP